MIKYSLFLLVFLAACKPALKPESLTGTWKYVKVESPNQNPPDSISKYVLQEQSPSIRFTGADSLIIVWDGKVLSHGTFTIVGNNIQYTEILSSGKTRSFPFYVSQITGSNLVFETLGVDGTRVTAIKE
jgi:hypothetical protein